MPAVKSLRISLKHHRINLATIVAIMQSGKNYCFIVADKLRVNIAILSGDYEFIGNDGNI
ncbi:hypothetical protein BGI32_04305 [Snodgrassella alvi]|uniref:Uncharacterized protein n=1 Tax=Snodgrassella alvi TaxID=1196083 RepID=A0A2N9WUY0_9NEIS|nr:hypothetical protein [Snodgrassella alvi]PIT16643.1 hypothetical protein BGI32_04305 [Snodgrassella alvi]